MIKILLIVNLATTLLLIVPKWIMGRGKSNEQIQREAMQDRLAEYDCSKPILPASKGEITG